MMATGVFKWRGGLKYKGTKARPNPRPQIYPHEYQTFFIIGEEDKAWEKVAKLFHRPKDGDKVIMEDKRIENIQELGYSMQNKDGSIRKQ